MPVTAAQTRRLVRPLLRVTDWTPVVSSGACALAIVWLITWDSHSGMEELLVALRAAAILLGLAAAFVLDDPAADVTAAAPCPLLLRRALRVALVSLPTAALWGAALSIAARKPLPESSALPVPLLTLELATIIMIALALAATAIRWSDSRSVGPAAAAGLLGITVMTWLVPEGARPWVYPAQKNWVAAHWWWGVVLVTALACFSWISLDRRLWRRNELPGTVSQPPPLPPPEHVPAIGNSPPL